MAHASAKSDHFHAVTASFLGWTLDAFDFFLLTFVIPDIAKEFTIIANIGDQRSDLDGGYSERTWRVPNPFYFIP